MSRGWSKLLYKYIGEITKEVELRLDFWRSQARQIPDQLLQQQALASIRDKKFHCLGGAIFGLYPGAKRQQVLDFIVAFQTISDYLDNLCDRARIQNEMAFRQLHYAMQDAIRPGTKQRNYYLHYPHQQDGGYLHQLVKVAQEALAKLNWDQYRLSLAFKWVKLYCDLQVYKHLDWDVREEKLKHWAKTYGKEYQQLYPMEFAAATGSTLGVFALVAGMEPEEARVYFPWISGLHILLDYYIDQKEDRREGDLNFHFYYPELVRPEERLVFFFKQATIAIDDIEARSFHELVIYGLLAMYLSDPKTSQTELFCGKHIILQETGSKGRILYYLCLLLRKVGRL